ncbi:uncharacterized protein LOC122509128 isoform X2 [Leptopilina heterotoma]|uniref:uncharacterized protein LOC122509128 isoform X2 n=1 Tax=Leptopilina heterotoma TaxID=63436 RepID=UPI001CAA2F90|nr:uncharacterized protein LOC122509128 isoform X2 [Leptopilina heterotoma]
MFRFISLFVLLFCILFVTDGFLFHRKKSNSLIHKEHEPSETEKDSGSFLKRSEFARSSGRSDESFERSDPVRSSGRSDESFERSDSGRGSGRSGESFESSDSGRGSGRRPNIFPRLRPNRGTPKHLRPASYSADDEFYVLKDPQGGKFKQL